MARHFGLRRSDESSPVSFDGLMNLGAIMLIVAVYLGVAVGLILFSIKQSGAQMSVQPSPGEHVVVFDDPVTGCVYRIFGSPHGLIVQKSSSSCQVHVVTERDARL